MNKRFILFPPIFLSIYFNVMLFTSRSGYFTALFMRNDLFYFMLVVPLFLVMFIFGFIYMALQINWKDDIKTYWKRLAMLVTYVYIFLINIFIPDIYMTASISLQALIGLIPICAWIGLVTPTIIKTVKDIKEAK